MRASFFLKKKFMNNVMNSMKQNASKQNTKQYSVQEVAKLAGVSVRTLHVYDDIGLLEPATRTEARYRLYGEKELLRLQQILFYKELDFSLQEIKGILDAPDFDIVQALEQHKTSLLARQERLTTLLTTIDKTITHITQGDYIMTVEELYEGLPKEFATDYREEAHKRWGNAVKHSEEALRRMNKADFNTLKNDFKENWNALSGMITLDPTSDAVQERIMRHYTLTRAFWGTSATADKQAAQFKGLGMLYTEDPRYTQVDGKPNSDFAEFMRKAMAFFADTALASA